MKIVRSVRAAYDKQIELNELLRKRFFSLIESNIEPKWHYEDRIKSLDSFALKLETGRFDPEALEDFFACTIVVENTASIQKARKIIDSKCVIVGRRPKHDNQTTKTPEQFAFDDLRLYVKLKQDPALPPDALSEIVFEVQIKTYLQHAWAIATHDLIYKSDDVSWAQQRIAFQTKAILESAETAIVSSSELSKAATIDMEDKKTTKLKNAIQLLNTKWNKSLLPNDLIRLARTVVELSEATGLSLGEIGQCLDNETRAGRGTKRENLSPYLVIVQSLISAGNRKFKIFMTTSNPDNRFRVLVTDEVDIPAAYPDLDASKVLSC